MAKKRKEHRPGFQDTGDYLQDLTLDDVRKARAEYESNPTKKNKAVWDTANQRFLRQRARVKGRKAVKV